MKIAQVIHGYPPDYMAGSEVYTYNLSKELARSHEVHVFTRYIDKDEIRYSVKNTTYDGVNVYRINNPQKISSFDEVYLDKTIEDEFNRFLGEVNPDVVHFGHLNHLSMFLVKQAKDFGVPVIFTLHDFWLICQRGQYINPQMEICGDQSVDKCRSCLSSHYAAHPSAQEMELRMKAARETLSMVDIFIAPSRFLMSKFVEFGVPEDKIIYSDYGFDTDYFKDFHREPSATIRFGYIGTHIPTKGVDVLIRAFNNIEEKKAVLKIYGPSSSNTNHLKSLVDNVSIEFMGGYKNWEVADVLARLDAIVVPSIWYENSPLVIHEAFMAGIPVIASDMGGMAEYVDHMKNGLLFKLGDYQDLMDKMSILIEQPELIQSLGNNAPAVKSIEENAIEMINIYRTYISRFQDASE